MIFWITSCSIFKRTLLKWIKRARGPIATIKTILCYGNNAIMLKFKQFRINWRMCCNYRVSLALQVYDLSFQLIWVSWVTLEVIYFHSASLSLVKEAKHSPTCHSNLPWKYLGYTKTLRQRKSALQTDSKRKNSVINFSLCIAVWTHTHLFLDTAYDKSSNRITETKRHKSPSTSFSTALILDSYLL